MNKTQYRQIEMFQVVLKYMEEDHPIWEHVPVVSRKVGELREMTRRIAEALMRQRWPRGATAAKNQVRLQCEQSIQQSATVLAVWADSTQNAALAAQTRWTPSGLSHLSGLALETTGDRILALLTEHQAALSDWGMTDADADTAVLGSVLEKYRQVMTAPRQAIADRANETALLRRLIRDTARLLRRHLDKLMLQFRTSHPEFFAGYEGVRIVLLRKPRRHSGLAAPKRPARRRESTVLSSQTTAGAPQPTAPASQPTLRPARTTLSSPRTTVKQARTTLLAARTAVSSPRSTVTAAEEAVPVDGTLRMASATPEPTSGRTRIGLANKRENSSNSAESSPADGESFPGDRDRLPDECDLFPNAREKYANDREKRTSRMWFMLKPLRGKNSVIRADASAFRESDRVFRTGRRAIRMRVRVIPT